MDEPREYHTKWSKLEKDKYHMLSLICGIFKNDTNELIYKIEIDSQSLKIPLWLKAALESESIQGGGGSL